MSVELFKDEDSLGISLGRAGFLGHAVLRNPLTAEAMRGLYSEAGTVLVSDTIEVRPAKGSVGVGNPGSIHAETRIDPEDVPHAFRLVQAVYATMQPLLAGHIDVGEAPTSVTYVMGEPSRAANRAVACSIVLVGSIDVSVIDLDGSTDYSLNRGDAIFTHTAEAEVNFAAIPLATRQAPLSMHF